MIWYLTEVTWYSDSNYSMYMQLRDYFKYQHIKYLFHTENQQRYILIPSYGHMSSLFYLKRVQNKTQETSLSFMKVKVHFCDLHHSLYQCISTLKYTIKSVIITAFISCIDIPFKPSIRRILNRRCVVKEKN